ncbi:MAG TPA: MFS transporter [Burkholderiaceae bacterium]|nr:MFS transporter [Burkholderiaceae bacterium]
MSAAGDAARDAPLATPSAPDVRPGDAPPLRARDHVAYGGLRAPLALLELPLFVLLPTFYAETLGVDLSAIGAVLFLTRLLDAVVDPAIGVALDRRPGRTTHRRAILWSLPVLALAYAAVFSPPSGVSPVAWLAVASSVTYVAYSVVSIAYQAWGARLGDGPLERVRVTASREGFGLLGVLLSASLLLPERAGWLVALFVAAAALAALGIARAPLPAVAPPPPGPRPTLRATLAASWRDVAGNRPFRWMLAAFMINGIATAIPATLVLFYVGDVLLAPQRAPMFLIAYFLAAAIGMPIWVRIARRAGLRNAWLFGMALAVFAFVWAFGLGEGDTLAFLAVCIVTGFALGADLAVPPALLANVLADEGAPRSSDGAFFGVWNLATKINLATAAGLALPMLGVLGYAPASQPGSTLALSATYALLPSALKLVAGFVLLLAPLPLDDDRSAESPP